MTLGAEQWNRDLLLKRGKISESLVTQMLGWQHSGFGVHHAVRLDADDLAGRQRLAQYMLRCPFSLERMIRVTEQGTVIYLAEKKACRRFPKPASGDLFGGSPTGSPATSRSSTPWTSSPSSPRTSPTPASIWCATSASTRIRDAACEPKPTATRRTMPGPRRRHRPPGPADAGPP